MATVSKNWKFDLNAALNAEVQTMAKGAFDLVAAAAVSYIENVYWTVPAVPAAKVTENLHGLMGMLGYNKSSKYELANAAMALARNWGKKYGAPHAKELNVFWSTILAAETYAEMIDFVVAAIKADYEADTMSKLYLALNPAKAAKAKETTLAERVKSSLGKADANDASAAALAAVPFLASDDKLAALAAMVDGLDAAALTKAFGLINARMAALNAEAEKQGVGDVAATAAKQAKRDAA